MRRTLIVLALLATLTACSERVPPGYVGMVMQPEGLTGEVLGPGNHSCYNRDRMILIPTVEIPTTESMDIMCLDDLNLSFDLKMRSRLRATDASAIKEVLNRQGAQIVWNGNVGTLPFEKLYTTYLRDPARSITRGLVSQYETTSVRENRATLQDALAESIVNVSVGTPVEVVMVATSNFDYPDVITDANEKRRAREIEIDEEKAKQAMELLRAQNRLKTAQALKAARVAEAEAEAAYVNIIGRALTSEYLQLRRIETDLALYSQAGNKTIVTGSATPLIGVN